MNHYYIFKKDGAVQVYEEKDSSSSKKNEWMVSVKELKVSEEKQKKLTDIINSPIFFEFQKYNQSDFKNKIPAKENLPPPCMISDATEYSMLFIQNNKQNFYTYYAPEYYLEKCKHISINKAMLKEYINLLKEFWAVKLYENP